MIKYSILFTFLLAFNLALCVDTQTEPTLGGRVQSLDDTLERFNLTDNETISFNWKYLKDQKFIESLSVVAFDLKTNKTTLLATKIYNEGTFKKYSPLGDLTNEFTDKKFVIDSDRKLNEQNIILSINLRFEDSVMPFSEVYNLGSLQLDSKYLGVRVIIDGDVSFKSFIIPTIVTIGFPIGFILSVVIKKHYEEVEEKKKKSKQEQNKTLNGKFDGDFYVEVLSSERNSPNDIHKPLLLNEDDYTKVVPQTSSESNKDETVINLVRALTKLDSKRNSSDSAKRMHSQRIASIKDGENFKI